MEKALKLTNIRFAVVAAVFLLAVVSFMVPLVEVILRRQITSANAGELFLVCFFLAGIGLVFVAFANRDVVYSWLGGTADPESEMLIDISTLRRRAAGFIVLIGNVGATLLLLASALNVYGTTIVDRDWTVAFLGFGALLCLSMIEYWTSFMFLRDVNYFKQVVHRQLQIHPENRAHPHRLESRLPLRDADLRPVIVVYAGPFARYVTVLSGETVSECFGIDLEHFAPDHNSSNISVAVNTAQALEAFTPTGTVLHGSTTGSRTVPLERNMHDQQKHTVSDAIEAPAIQGPSKKANRGHPDAAMYLVLAIAVMLFVAAGWYVSHENHANPQDSSASSERRSFHPL